MTCRCGHHADDHQDRCAGECYDPDYGTYKCLCPAYVGATA